MGSTCYHQSQRKSEGLAEPLAGRKTGSGADGRSHLSLGDSGVGSRESLRDPWQLPWRQVPLQMQICLVVGKIFRYRASGLESRESSVPKVCQSPLKVDSCCQQTGVACSERPSCMLLYREAASPYGPVWNTEKPKRKHATLRCPTQLMSLRSEMG